MARAAMAAGIGYAKLRGLIFTGAVRARQLPNGRWLVDEGGLRAWTRTHQKAAAKQAPRRVGAESAA